MFATKSLGSSVFFLVFPLLTIISLDEEGQGLLLFRDERKAKFQLPCFTWTIHVKNYVLGFFVKDKTD
jgi:hypothetical protein